MPAPRLSLSGIHKTFGKVTVLDDVALELHPGEVHALLGENGAGKSTLMRILAGALRPEAGHMTLDGERYAPRDPDDARSAGVAMIHQELALAPSLSVLDNVLLGRAGARFGLVPRRSASRDLEAVLARLGHAELRPGTRVGDLDATSRQIVEWARALYHGARVLILDEPTTSLASRDVDRLFDALRRLRGEGTSIVYISHFLDEVLRIADRMTVLRDGRVVDRRPVADASTAILVRAMLGRDQGELFPPKSRTPGNAFVRLEAVSGTARPHGASLEIRRGEILGIGGQIGSGRSETLRLLYGLEPLVAGTIRVGMTMDRGAPVQARIRQGIALLSEDRKSEGLALDLPLSWNITLSRRSAFSRLGVLSPRRRADFARRAADDLLVRRRSENQRTGELSGGNQQKVALARLLHQEAELYLLDEPTRGVDVGSRAEIYRWLDARCRAGAAVVVVSSQAPELLGLADRIAILVRGTLTPPRAAASVSEADLYATDVAAVATTPR